MYDGTTNDDDGGYPILMAIKDDVFDVSAKDGRHFYGPNGEYRIMAGRDASRFLAKNIVIEETHDEGKVKLSVGEEANLEMWYWIIRNKYLMVGTYENNNGERDAKITNNSKKREQLSVECLTRARDIYINTII